MYVERVVMLAHDVVPVDWAAAVSPLVAAGGGGGGGGFDEDAGPHVAKGDGADLAGGKAHLLHVLKREKQVKYFNKETCADFFLLITSHFHGCVLELEVDGLRQLVGHEKGRSDPDQLTR